jgi:hypothetical protein
MIMEKKDIYNLILVFVVGIVGGLLAAHSYMVFNSKTFSPVSINKIEQTTYITENESLEKGIEDARGSMVAIKGSKGVFSGIIITNDGLVATAASNLGTGDKVFLAASGESVDYNVLKKDLAKDIAIIKIKKNQLSPVEFFDFDKLKAGKRIYTVSFFEDGEKFYDYANEGMIRSSKFPIETDIVSGVEIPGSPVFDIENRLVGIAKRDGKGAIVITSSEDIRVLARLD